MNTSFRWRSLIFAILVLTSCATPQVKPVSESVADITGRIPKRVPNREGWARDVHRAIKALDLDPTAERVCAVLAVIEQESGYKVDPTVANLPSIVRDGLRKKLDRLGPLAKPALEAILSGSPPGSEETFAQRIDRLRTERDLDRFFRDIKAAYRERLPGSFVVANALSRLMGPGDFDELNPVTTAGSMQVKITFARGLKEFRGLDDGEARDLLYTRYGGIRAGTARLLGYRASYDSVLYRFADYNAGVYASRNAAFQKLVTDLTGQDLTLDGDLLSYDDDGDPASEDSQSLKAILTFARSQDMWEWFVRRGVRHEKEEDFEDTGIWQEVRAAWKDRQGKDAPYARLPEVALASPKLSGRRTTAWFAQSVMRRYEACR